MDAIVKPLATPEVGTHERPSRAQAEEAVRTLIAWAGDDPARAGLVDTPGRVLNAYTEMFDGYQSDTDTALTRTFDDVGGYDEMVLLRDIEVNSHCEHHMMPFIGRAHVAYLPGALVVGISKLVRVVDIFAHRLQSQEKMTAQIANAIDAALAPRGTAVLVQAVHQCMTMRGVQKPGVATITTQFSGAFKTDKALRGEFMGLVQKS
ncbi:MAG: GTP cyclohydrolase I FolE [Alphaproteobacteria bacterium]